MYIFNPDQIPDGFHRCTFQSSKSLHLDLKSASLSIECWHHCLHKADILIGSFEFPVDALLESPVRAFDSMQVQSLNKTLKITQKGSPLAEVHFVTYLEDLGKDPSIPEEDPFEAIPEI